MTSRIHARSGQSAGTGGSIGTSLALALCSCLLWLGGCSNPEPATGPGQTGFVLDSTGPTTVNKKDADSGSTKTDSGTQDTTGEEAEDSCAEPGGCEDAVPDSEPEDTEPFDSYTGPVCSGSGACKNLPDTPFCATGIKQCVECLTDYNCADGKECIGHKCQGVSCQPGSTYCDGKFLAICNDIGDGVELTSCPTEAPVCLNGACVACEPGKTFCAPVEPGQQLSLSVLKCDNGGTAYDVLKSCGPGESCSLGKDFKPYCQSCVPGNRICNGEKGMVCADDGSGYDVFEDCGSKGLACQGGICVNPCDKDIKSNTNVGCDYWAVDLDNAKVPNGSGGYYDAQNSQFSVIISNTKSKPTLVTVEAGTGQKQSYTVQGFSLKILNLPDPAWKVPALNQDNTNINKNVYRIKSDQPIVAYQFNPLQNYDVFSNDASLLLPSNSIGKEYWVMSREQSHDLLKSYFTVVATQSGTTVVKVTSSAVTLPGPSIKAMKVGDKQEFVLQQGQVLNVETNAIGADPTGSWIQADKSIAVFGGSEASNSPNSDKCIAGKCQTQGWACATAADCPKTCCADHLEEQLFPVSSWGKIYHATKLKKRGKEKDAWRILAADDGTVVTTSPQQAKIPTLSKGQWFEFESDQDFVIEATKPVQVAQYMASANAPGPNNDECAGSYLGQKVCSYFWNTQQTPISCTKNADCPNIQEAGDAKIGDPAMIAGVAVDQYLDNYVFLVPDKYTENYINVVAPATAKVTLDQKPVLDSQFTTFATGWKVTRMPVVPGAHTLTSTLKVGVVVYGWADYVSYGYPGGAALK